MGDAAAFIPDAARERMLFVIPWLDAVLVGTTDDAYDGDLNRPGVTAEDRAYCLDALNSAFDLRLDDAHVAGAYAGLRPLISGRSGATADLSRRHSVYDIAPGIIGITGGKMTTYRRMAQDAVDRIAGELEVTEGSKTRWIRLGSSDVGALRLAVERRARRHGWDQPVIDNLVRCYGDRALDVLDVAEGRGLAGPLVPGGIPVAAEAAYCAQAEMVVHLNDLLTRRTRLSFTDRSAGVGRDASAAQVLGAALGWSRRRIKEEVAAHRDAIGSERGMTVPDHPRTSPPARDSAAS